MKDAKYKELSIKEFTKAAKVYESDHAGVYTWCRYDYLPILEELEKTDFKDVLDVGCGPGTMLELLSKKYPENNYIGLDLTPKMIEVANAKNLPNTKFVVGDSENLPFEDESFDAVICANSLHHYPNPQRFFYGVKRVLKPNGILVLRDFTSNPVALFLFNYIEMKVLNLFGYGDVRIYSRDQIKAMCALSGLEILKLEKRKKFRLHLVATKK